MNVKGGLLAALFGLLPALALAQGFAGLGTSAEGFAIPQRGVALEFPRDHGAHPDYRIEWWYLTATLQGEDGRDYGLQWTLFRSALAPADTEGWQSPQIWMGHAAVTTPENHYYAERLARGGIGQAGVATTPFRAWIDDWQLTATGDDIDSLALSARGNDFSYDMTLRAQGPLVFHGDDGFSVKSALGQASYYYSQPAYHVSGQLSLPGGPVRVTGQGWLDREWSSQPLARDQTGWDWFSLVFDGGARMMGFRLRDDGPGFTSATWIYPDGSSRSFDNGALTVTPLSTATVANRSIPIRWRVELPDQQLDAEVTVLNPNAWMGTSVPYWEGPVRISGSHTGRGYLEMTGYQ